MRQKEPTRQEVLLTEKIRTFEPKQGLTLMSSSMIVMGIFIEFDRFPGFHPKKIFDLFMQPP